LGAIDAQYDVAISTACGNLDNIVVETTEAGQACVQYLRENNLGRATFIIMEKIDYLRNQLKPIQVPDKAKRYFINRSQLYKIIMRYYFHYQSF
jgi:structural maintenance of chromosome 4